MGTGYRSDSLQNQRHASLVPMGKRFCVMFAVVLYFVAVPGVRADSMIRREVEAAPCIPVAHCDSVYDPVCGSDGTTYINKCLAHAQKRDCDVHLSYVPGKCKDKPPCEPNTSYCPTADVPLCGSDGETYTNICFAEAQKKECDFTTDALTRGGGHLPRPKT
eukprot:Selendium_serpulae@DN6407_c0_g3_i1.p1